MLRKNNLAEVMAAEAALNDQEQISQRPTLALPQAQVTEREIETIAKLNQKAAIEDANSKLSFEFLKAAIENFCGKLKEK